jgi:hypothetical protein
MVCLHSGGCAVSHIFGYFDAIEVAVGIFYLGYRAIKHQPPFNK